MVCDPTERCPELTQPMTKQLRYEVALLATIVRFLFHVHSQPVSRETGTEDGLTMLPTWSEACVLYTGGRRGTTLRPTKPIFF